MRYVIINTRQKICRTKFSPGGETGKIPAIQYLIYTLKKNVFLMALSRSLASKQIQM